jgi:hypothetical protein
MLVNALAATNPYADFWSHLKSMHTAVERALNLPPTVALSALDRERLLALSEFLQSSVIQAVPDDPAAAVALLASDDAGVTYTPDIDVKEKLRSIQAFQEWKSASRAGGEKKIQHLAGSVLNFLQKPGADLFVRDVPREEFEILSKILIELLRDTQSALLVEL